MIKDCTKCCKKIWGIRWFPVSLQKNKFMSNLYAKIHTDNDVCRWLQEHVDNGEVKINKRRDGGLDIDVTYRTAFKNVNDYARVKNYLRKNGFTSIVGLHSRQRIDVEIPRDQFTRTYLIGDNFFDAVMSNLKF